jgi:hypothetical protein
MLQKFIADDDSRTKAKTIISSLSNPNDDKEGWRQLRKELQGTGISPESFSENLDLIIAIFRTSFEPSRDSVVFDEPSVISKALYITFMGCERAICQTDAGRLLDLLVTEKVEIGLPFG